MKKKIKQLILCLIAGITIPFHAGAQSEQEQQIIQNASRFGDSQIVYITTYTNDIPAYLYDQTGLYIQEYTPSELHWEEQGIHLIQQTTTQEEIITASFIIEADGPAQLPFMFRYPADTKNISVKINSKEISVEATPGHYITLNRTWQDMDIIEITIK